MKRVICIVLGIVMLVVARPVLAKEFKLGVVGGMNLANMDVNVENWIQSDKAMFALGIVVDYQLYEQLSLVMEPMYLKKGGTNLTREGIIYQFKRSYLEVPIFLKYSFGRVVKPFITAGPTIGFLLDADLSGNHQGYPLSGDMKDLTRKVDVGINVGAGIGYSLRFAAIFIKGQYTLGLTNTVNGGTMDIIWKSQQVEGGLRDEDVFKNRGLQVLIGVTFPVGKK